MQTDSSESNEALVEQFQSGEQLALAKLVKRWHKEFCNKAFWVTKDANLSKDIAQDSWNTIMLKINDLKDPKYFGSWAFRIVYSKSLDALRDHQKNRNELKAYGYNQSEFIEEPIDDSDLKKNLLKQISELPEAQQVVLKLFYLEEYSLKETGRILNISIGTAKSRLFYAREQLKKQLKNRNYEN